MNQAFPETFIAAPSCAVRYKPMYAGAPRGGLEIFLGRYGAYDVFAYAVSGDPTRHGVFIDPTKVKATDWFGFWLIGFNGKVVQQHHLNPVEASDTQFLSWVKSAKAVVCKLGLFRPEKT